MPIPLADFARTPKDAVFVVFNICLATSIVLTNTMLLSAFLSSRELMKRNNYLYAFSITLTDLIVGAGWFYLGLFSIRYNNAAYGSPEKIFPTIHSISIITLLAAITDRYCAVQHPFRYAQKMTRAKTLAIIAFTWLIPLLSLFMQAMNPGDGASSYQGFITIVFTVGMLGIIILLNARLYVVARRQQNREKQRSGNSNNRSAWLIIITATFSIIFWAPALLHLVICTLSKRCISIDVGQNPLIIIQMLNTLSTPITFLVGSPLTRASLKNLARIFRFKR